MLLIAFWEVQRCSKCRAVPHQCPQLHHHRVLDSSSAACTFLVHRESATDAPQCTNCGPSSASIFGTTFSEATLAMCTEYDDLNKLPAAVRLQVRAEGFAGKSMSAAAGTRHLALGRVHCSNCAGARRGVALRPP